jgi:hypothetical protein
LDETGGTLPPEDRNTLNYYAECYLLQRAKILEIAGDKILNSALLFAPHYDYNAELSIIIKLAT